MCVRCRLLLHVPRVCRLDMTVSCAKMAEPIMMLFGLWTWLGPRNHVGAWILPGGVDDSVGYALQCGLSTKFFDDLSDCVTVLRHAEWSTERCGWGGNEQCCDSGPHWCLPRRVTLHGLHCHRPRRWYLPSLLILRVPPGPWKSLNLKAAKSRPWMSLKMKMVLESPLKNPGVLIVGFGKFWLDNGSLFFNFLPCYCEFL